MGDEEPLPVHKDLGCVSSHTGSIAQDRHRALTPFFYWIVLTAEMIQGQGHRAQGILCSHPVQIGRCDAAGLGK